MVKIGIVTGNATAASLTLVSDAERLGVDSVWIPEAWMFDGLTPAAFVAGRTETMRIGTACVQLGSRSPALLAMSALSLQAMSGGRFILGMGSSGPQVMEGWHGVRFDKPVPLKFQILEHIKVNIYIIRLGPNFPWIGCTPSSYLHRHFIFIEVLVVITTQSNKDVQVSILQIIHIVGRFTVYEHLQSPIIPHIEIQVPEYRPRISVFEVTGVQGQTLLILLNKIRSAKNYLTVNSRRQHIVNWCAVSVLFKVNGIYCKSSFINYSIKRLDIRVYCIIAGEITSSSKDNDNTWTILIIRNNRTCGDRLWCTCAGRNCFNRANKPRPMAW